MIWGKIDPAEPLSRDAMDDVQQSQLCVLEQFVGMPSAVQAIQGYTIFLRHAADDCININWSTDLKVLAKVGKQWPNRPPPKYQAIAIVPNAEGLHDALLQKLADDRRENKSLPWMPIKQRGCKFNMTERILGIVDQLLTIGECNLQGLLEIGSYGNETEGKKQKSDVQR